LNRNFVAGYSGYLQAGFKFFLAFAAITAPQREKILAPSWIYWFISRLSHLKMLPGRAVAVLNKISFIQQKDHILYIIQKYLEIIISGSCQS